MVANTAIVIDSCARIYNCITTYYNPGLDNRACHDLGAFFKDYVISHDHARVHNCRKSIAAMTQRIEYLAARPGGLGGTYAVDQFDL